MAISKEIIEEIKYKTDIAQLISEYTPLKRSGKNLMGLCPFHSEKTPSFSVIPEKSFFHCFGCGAGGDAISFVMRMENMTYPEAIEYLGKRCGVEVVNNEEKAYHGVSRDKIRAANKDAAKFFFEQLRKSPAAAKYLRDRGVDPTYAVRFGIGYAPEGFGNLYTYLHGLGYDDETLISAFLCKRSEKNGKLYDIFRNRIMFPIFDDAGENVIAFGGRIIGDEKPKYLNSGDTPVYTKSRVLFALNFARKNCAESLILCEGYMDTLSLHMAGFDNAVATCGTALTVEQARLMRRHTKKVIICYDADEAGQNAAKKAFDILGDAGLETGLVKVKDAKDPDEFIKKFGAIAFRNLLEGNVSKFDFEYANITAKYDLNTPDGKIGAAKELTESLSNIYYDSERDSCIRRAAERLGITYDYLRSDVERTRRKQDGAAKRQENREIVASTIGLGDRVNRDRASNAAAVSAEESVLGILGLHPELIGKAIDGETALREEDFVSDLNRRFFRAMNELRGDFDTTLIGDRFSLDEISRLTACVVSRRNLSNNGLEEINKCIEPLRKKKAEKELPFDEYIRQMQEKHKKEREEMKK